MGRFDPGVRHVVPVADIGNPHPAEVEAAFLGGHQVGENLARVVVVRQPVDHGNGRSVSYLLGNVVGERPYHDSVNVPGQNTRRVPDGFPPPDLGVRRR
jgi:hypothetical protein